MVSVSAPIEAAVVAAASVTWGPVTLTMVSLAGIPAPEIFIPTSAEVTVPVEIMTVRLALRKVPVTPMGGVGLGAHLRRTRLAAVPFDSMKAICFPSRERIGDVVTAYAPVL
jgi:hypothetical protein